MRGIAAVTALLFLTSAAAAEDAEDADKLVLVVAGDIAWPDGWGGIEHIDKQKEKLFELVQPILDSGDLKFANLECPFTDTKSVLKKTYPITCQPKRLAYAVDAGFNLLSLANNHSLDAGLQGIIDTNALVEKTNSDERPLWWGGIGETKEQANKTVFFTPPGKNAKVAFIALANSGGASAHVGSFNSPELGERIEAAAGQADIVIVSVHYGPEYIHVPSKNTVDRYHKLIDAGATVVISHHAHVVQGVEAYNNGFIFYNLGNFSFGSRTRRHLETGARMYSMMGRVVFENNKISEVELLPLYANNSRAWCLGDEALDARHATPQLLEGAFAQAAMDEFEDFASQVPTDKPTRLYRVGDRMFAELHGKAPKLEDEALHLHEQLHEYQGCATTGSVAREATPQEKQWANKAGTPLHYKPQPEKKQPKKKQRNRKQRNRKPGK